MSDPSRPATGYPIHPNGHPPPAATAYPFQAQPTTNPPPYYYNAQPYYPNQRATLFRRLIASFVAVVVIFFVILFICWLVIRPHLPEFQVTSFTLSNFNASVPAEHVSGNWNARFNVYNPNKKLKISYDPIGADVLYKSDSLSSTQIAPFQLDTKAQTTIAAAFSAAETYVTGRIAGQMNEDKTRGSVSFDVRLAGGVTFKVGGMRARRRMLTVWCKNLAVAVSANRGSGNLTGGARQCSVYA